MCKKMFYSICFVLALGMAAPFCTMTMASDIAFYVGQWNTDGWYDASQFDDVDTIIAETGHLFKDIQQFDDDQFDEFGAWVDENTDDGEMDIIWLNGCMPSVLYQFPNVNPDGSRAEEWLDGGNMIINVSDWFAYCSFEGGARQADNTGTGAENILDLSGPIAGEAHGAMVVTSTGEEYLPSLNAIAVDRPVSLSAVVDPWEVAAIFGENADGTHADPVVIHNTETDGYMAFINQGGAGNWIDDRGLTCAEFIGNWVVEQGLLGRGNPYARGPDPKDGAMIADTWYYMSWSPGVFAVSHDVYFGENFDDVNDGTPGSSGFWVNQDTTMLFVGFIEYPYPDGLVPGTTYYWRVDEVNDTDPNSPWKGDVWSFWIQPRIAYEPVPADGTKFVDPNADLSWMAGLFAKAHYVYFGDNFDDVNGATGGLTHGATTYAPGTLEVDKTYYWRVDESADNITMQKGDVWSFKTLPDVPLTSDPNLIGWWKLDEGEGTTAVDWSGRGNHGTLQGNPQWVDGYDGGALECDGSGDWITTGLMPADYGLDGANAKTVTAWVYTTGFNNGGIFDMGSQSDGQEFCLRTTTTVNEWRVQRWGYPTYDFDVTYPTQEQWVHFAQVYSENLTTLYANGASIGTKSVALNTANAAFVIGRYGSGTGFNGIIDDVRVFNKALTQEEVMETMRGDPLLAGIPNPTNGSTAYIREATPLSWLAGDNAAQHDVYFGIDRDAVADANASDTTGVYRGRQFGTSYTPLEGVEWGGGPYYWRVDEYNTDATISEGRIWSFTVADYILVDDFELYNDLDTDNPESNRIYTVWSDGWGVDANGSEIGYAEPDFLAGEHIVETNIVHGGSQSMPYFYNNSGPAYYSEATYSPTQPNWTEEGVGVLSLWFRGNPAGFVEGPAGTYTMSGAGTDIWGTADEFRYAWKRLSGAGTISAQVLSVEDTDGWAKAGVMIRESLDPGSKFAALYIAPDNGCRFQARLVTGVDAVSDSDVTTLANIEAPHWIKIERDAAGNFNAYNSDDGVTWTPLAWNPQNISMATSVYIGLALTSHSSGVTCVAEFSDVETTGAVTPLTWTHEAIGATMAANDPAPMYIALNGSAAVYHDNPDAAQINTWTEWTIDLQAFTGVSLTNVNTLAIGFGDKNNIQAGGSGLVFFDDIRLYRPAPSEPEPEQESAH